MKRILTILTAFLVGLSALYAQDARQRNVETIVADVLAQLPAGNAADFNSQLADLSGSAPASVNLLAKMLSPAGTGANNLAEYALSGLVSYVSSSEGAACRDKVHSGLAAAVAECKDPTNKNFLLSQLRLVAGAEDVALMKGYASDKALAATAVGALTEIPGGQAALLDLIKGDGADRSLLSAAAAKSGLSEAEPYLLAWAGNAAGAEKNSICEALGKIGSAASMKVLSEASPSDYAVLLGNLAASGQAKTAVKAAKSLLKKTDDSFLKTAAAGIIVGNGGRKAALKTLSAALAGNDRPYRNSVIGFATDALGAAAVAPVLTKKFSSLGTDARTDIVNWLGNNAVAEELDLVKSQFGAGGELAAAAVAAAGKIGGDDALQALIAELGGSNSDAALSALKSFKGDLGKSVIPAIGNAPDAAATAALLSLASTKKMTGASPAVFKLLSSDDATVRNAAVSALAGVVGVNDIPKVGRLLDQASTAEVEPMQKALASALHTLSPDEIFQTVNTLMGSAANPSRYYPALAQSGTDAAVEALSKAFKGGDAAALASLKAIDNVKAAPVLLDAVKAGVSGSESCIERYVSLLDSYENDADRKRLGYADALSLATEGKTRSNVLSKLAKVPTMKSFLLAGRYLESDDPVTSYAAASAVKTLASKTTEEIDADIFKKNLNLARGIYASRNGADDGYAVDEIDKLLSGAGSSPKSSLTPEEAAAGFEMLFDGTDLSKFQGDMEGYTPVNGAILVSANYGSTGNLYTKKEYRDFIFRFEFCFLRSGVNNGVGIRTPMGVDAAYDGMCECQILDHDAPMYANLHDYQVHGSVYGVVPAKRIVHKPLGEWSTEEIIVKGDRIKVTVNGEVIVDTDVRKACKGHNIAPDGGKKNPWTVDGKNHPGMFNEKGYISFCGHGSGLKLRNIRVLDLSR